MCDQFRIDGRRGRSRSAACRSPSRADKPSLIDDGKISGDRCDEIGVQEGAHSGRIVPDSLLGTGGDEGQVALWVAEDGVVVAAVED